MTIEKFRVNPKEEEKEKEEYVNFDILLGGQNNYPKNNPSDIISNPRIAELDHLKKEK